MGIIREDVPPKTSNTQIINDVVAPVVIILMQSGIFFNSGTDFLWSPDLLAEIVTVDAVLSSLPVLSTVATMSRIVVVSVKDNIVACIFDNVPEFLLNHLLCIRVIILLS